MAVSYPHESLIDSHQDGCTEGWIAEIVGALVKAHRPKMLVELGSFLGTTTAWLALAMDSTGEASTLFAVEPDAERARIVKQRLCELPLKNVGHYVLETPSPQVIGDWLDRSIDFAWIDNDHQRHHVEQEIVALWPKMRPGGIMCFHDVASDGVCQLGPLIRKYGGVALDLPRLGPDGGLGIIQVPL